MSESNKWSDFCLANDSFEVESLSKEPSKVISLKITDLKGNILKFEGFFEVSIEGNELHAQAISKSDYNYDI
jgi:hypothetical protein